MGEVRTFLKNGGKWHGSNLFLRSSSIWCFVEPNKSGYGLTFWLKPPEADRGMTMTVMCKGNRDEPYQPKWNIRTRATRFIYGCRRRTQRFICISIARMVIVRQDD